MIGIDQARVRSDKIVKARYKTIYVSSDAIIGCVPVVNDIMISTDIVLLICFKVPQYFTRHTDPFYVPHMANYIWLTNR